jgi:hypothetical protein
MELKEASIVPKPSYRVTLEGQEFNVTFDTNISDTKRGIKLILLLKLQLYYRRNLLILGFK